MTDFSVGRQFESHFLGALNDSLVAACDDVTGANMAGAILLKQDFATQVANGAAVQELAAAGGPDSTRLEEILEMAGDNVPVTGHLKMFKLFDLNTERPFATDQQVIDELIRRNIPEEEWEKVQKVGIDVGITDSDHYVPKTLRNYMKRYGVDRGFRKNDPPTIDVVWILPEEVEQGI